MTITRHDHHYCPKCKAFGKIGHYHLASDLSLKYEAFCELFLEVASFINS